MTRMGVKAVALSGLREPTPRDRVQQRQGNRKHDGNCDKRYGVCQLNHAILDYVTARFVMDRLDSIGSDNWQDRFEDRPDGSVRCGIGILVDGEWVWKWDVGTETDIESDKGSYSDAFKRAGVKWGIARDLYPDDKHATNATPPKPSRQAATQPTPPPAGAPASTEAVYVPLGPAPSLTGTVRKGDGQFNDAQYHQAPDGHRIGFRLDLGGRSAIHEVICSGAIGEALYLTVPVDELLGSTVTVEGERFRIDQPQRAARSRVVVSKITGRDFVIPAAADPSPAPAPDGKVENLDDLPF